jgi:ATP-dependent helicase YprA (DUF1998 family)
MVFEEDDPDNYDPIALDSGFAMLCPAEHSAQEPNEERERLEHLFKGEAEVVNTLVCTPTLELGVDIGGLDTILLRNVPPLPSNYWQRAGRAGRRHKLAVNLTYARAPSHDRAYFADPGKLLAGRVELPRFNLKNEVMFDKHVPGNLNICKQQPICSEALSPRSGRALAFPSGYRSRSGARSGRSILRGCIGAVTVSAP